MKFLVILTLYSFVSGYSHRHQYTPSPTYQKSTFVTYHPVYNIPTYHRHYFPHYNEKKTDHHHQYAAYPTYQKSLFATYHPSYNTQTLSIDIDKELHHQWHPYYNIPKTHKKNFVDLYLEQHMMNHWSKNILSRTDDVEREKLLNRLLWILQSDMYHRNSNKFIQQHLLNDLTGNILKLKDKEKQEQQLRQMHFLMQNGMLNENGNLALLIPEVWGGSYDKNMILPDIFGDITDLSIILLGMLEGSYDPYTMILSENLDDFGSIGMMLYPEIFGFGSNYFGSNYQSIMYPQLQDYYYDSDGLLQLMQMGTMVV